MSDGMRSRTRRAASVIASVLVVAGGIIVAVALHAQHKPPQPSAVRTRSGTSTLR